MKDVPLVVLVATVWAYWLTVGAMAVRARRRRHEAAAKPSTWLLWTPLVALWVFLPYAALTQTHPLLATPDFARDDPLYGGLRWIAAALAVASLLITIKCWRKMGDDWRMDVGARKTVLITDGPFRTIRHPIYAFSILLMLCSAFILPTPPMIAIALVHLALMNLKARNEERHLAQVHGDIYRRYAERTGRFFPRLSSREG
jgi:protein-S-isoprenylcysteine O-methyltransferase Ste14